MFLATTSEPKLLSSPRVDSAAVLTPRLRPAGISRAKPPRMPLGRKITTATSNVPIQKYQYCGLMPESWSRATM